MAGNVTRTLSDIKGTIKSIDQNLRASKSAAQAFARAIMVDPTNLKLTEGYNKELQSQYDNLTEKVQLLRKEQEKVKERNKDGESSKEYKELCSRIEACSAAMVILNAQLHPNKGVSKDLEEINQELALSKVRVDEFSKALLINPKSLKLSKVYLQELEKQSDTTKKKLELLNKEMEKFKNEHKGDTTSEEYKKLEIQIEDCNASLKLMETQIKQMKKLHLDNLSYAFQNIVAAVSKAISTIKSLMTDYADTASTLYNEMQKYNLSAEELQKQSNAWEKLTADSNSYTTVMDSMLSLTGQISKRTQRVDADIKAVGLTIDDVYGLSATDALNKIMEALGNMESKTQATQAAIALFGQTAGSYVMEMLDVSDQQLQQWNDDLEEAGILSDDEVASGKELSDVLSNFDKTLTKIEASLAISFQPMVEGILNVITALSPAIQSVTNWFASWPVAIQSVIVSLAVLLPVLAKIAVHFLAIRASAGDWGTVAATVVAFGAAIASIAAVGAGMGSTSTASTSLAGSSLSAKTTTGTEQTSTKETSRVYNDNSTNNYNISNEVDAQSVIDEINNRKRALIGG